MCNRAVNHNTLSTKTLFPLGFEPRTSRVWGERDNHYTTETHLAREWLKERFRHERPERYVMCNLMPGVTSVIQIVGVKTLHRPGIEPGPPAWQASILPLNHRCLLDIWKGLIDSNEHLGQVTFNCDNIPNAHSHRLVLPPSLLFNQFMIKWILLTFIPSEHNITLSDLKYQRLILWVDIKGHFLWSTRVWGLTLNIASMWVHKSWCFKEKRERLYFHPKMMVVNCFGLLLWWSKMCGCVFFF